jgi:hypothetical protein
MFFNANIRVTIAGAEIETVHSVASQNDAKQIGSSCDIVLPLNSRIKYKDGPHDQYLAANVTNAFKSGDAVQVTAWYDGLPEINVFTGFVYDFKEGTPTTIKCIDYIYFLEQNHMDLFYQQVTLKTLVEKVLEGSGISLVLPTIEMNLVNITFRMMTPAAILEYFKKELGFNISLTGNKLFIGLASTTLDSVVLASDRNVIECDLQRKDAIFSKIFIRAWYIKNNGTKTYLDVGDTGGQMIEQFFYAVLYDQATYRNLAREALKKAEQYRFKGGMQTLLYPEMDLFWKVTYYDVRYPDRSANYSITEMNFQLDERGFHRHLKLAYLTDI